VHDTTEVAPGANPGVPNVDDVVHHLFEAFRPQERHESKPADWPARDVTLGQLKTLFMLRGQGPLSIGHIAEAFGIGAAAASGYIERIERHGLLERRHRTDDRRVVECHLTESGAQLLEQLAGMRIDAMRQALGVLTPEELAEFDRLITMIASRLTPADAQS
jgi:DNA-binding MarR family transcriptional regulator